MIYKTELNFNDNLFYNSSSDLYCYIFHIYLLDKLLGVLTSSYVGLSGTSYTVLS